MLVFVPVTANSVLHVLYPEGYSVNKVNIQYSMVRCLIYVCKWNSLSLYQPIWIFLLWLMLSFFWLANRREERKSFDARMRQLQQELARAKESVVAVEAGMVVALASKNAEINSLSSSVESFKRQASMAEGKLAALQVGLWCPSPNCILLVISYQECYCLPSCGYWVLPHWVPYRIFQES